VAILSVAETLGAVVGRVVECEGLGAWHGERSVWAVVKLVAEIIFNLLGGCLEKVVSVGGAGVDLMIDPYVVLGVIVGAEEGLSIANAFNCGEGITAVALGALYRDDFVLVLVLILNRDGNVICKVVPVRLDAVFKHLAVDVNAGVGGGLGDVASEGVDDAFKWNNGKGIGVTDCTVYDLHVREETS
jgi:hypothetical protein